MNQEPSNPMRLTDPIPFDVRRGTMQRALLLSIHLVAGVACAADPLSEALQQGLLAEAATPPPNPAQTGPAAERDIPSAADPVNP